MSSSIKIGAGVVTAIAVLALLRFQPWRSNEASVLPGGGQRQTLNVGFLPVT